MGQLERYLEIALGGVHKRNVVIPLRDLPEYIKRAQARNEECYHSYYEYPIDILDWMRTNGSVKNYDGPVALSMPILDVDRGNSSDDQVLLKAQSVVHRLENEFAIPPDRIIVWYSGTGYHIGFPDIWRFPMSGDLPRLVKAILGKHFPEVDPIYDKTRLLRSPGTLNLKSNIRKQRIPLNEFLSFDGATKALRKLGALEKSPFFDNFEQVQESSENAPKSMVVPNRFYELQAIFDATKAPPSHSSSLLNTNFATCLQTLYDLGPQSGTRHNYILRIASGWRRGGMPFSATLGTLERWCPEIGKNEIERLIRTVYEQPLQYSCQDPIMAQHCTSKCRFYRYKNFGMNVSTSVDLEKAFATFARTDFSFSGFNLKDFYPSLTEDYTFLPGDLAIVTGDTKVGKTAFVQNLCVSLRPRRVLYVTLEVAGPLMYRRFVQISHSMSKQQVYDYYRTQSNTLSQDLDHLFVVAEPHSVPEIETLIYSMDPAVIVVDTIDGLTSRAHTDPNARSHDIALELRRLAIATNRVIIGVSHISKHGNKNMFGKEIPLHVHSIKGSSALEQKADKVIGVERDYKAKQTIVRTLASRDEGEFTLRLYFDVNTFQMKEVP